MAALAVARRRLSREHLSTHISPTLFIYIAGLFVLVCRESPQGSDVLIVANDKDQADQDLDLAKKLVRANGLDGDEGELVILAEEIRRKDGRPDVTSSGSLIASDGSVIHIRRDQMRILPLSRWNSRPISSSRSLKKPNFS